MFCGKNRKIIFTALLAPPPSGAAYVNRLASISKFCSSVADIPSLLDPDSSLEHKHSPEKTLFQPSDITKPPSDPVEPKPPAEPPDETKPSDADLKPPNDPAESEPPAKPPGDPAKPEPPAEPPGVLDEPEPTIKFTLFMRPGSPILIAWPFWTSTWRFSGLSHAAPLCAAPLCVPCLNAHEF
jgi:hypothetical protein